MNKQNKNTTPETSEEWPSRILIVEDDPDILQFMSKVLITLGITPTLAEDGQDAIDKLTAGPFPLVFTDMNMPHIDGMQLILHIRDHYPGTDVIAMTGYSEKYGLIDVIRAGAADYMTKPFTLNEIKAKIRRVTRERALLQGLQQEIAKQHLCERDLSREKNTLLEQVQQQKKELLEANTALRIMLRQRDIEKNELVSSFTNRFLNDIAPYLEKLQQPPLQEVQKHYLDILTINLESIFNPDRRGRTFNHTPFTEAEVRVINLIKQKKTSKEIAVLLQVSTGTIRTHRENIRKKLQITNNKRSLYKTLLSIP
ncbi:MAG: response regulator [Desulfocapsaceae bacterium]|nr:response regulator [Desulfocapsaceae bacterium]